MKNIYIGNLSYNTTEDSLRSTFTKYGQVEQVTVVRDQAGVPRGFGFVEMANDGDAAKAIAELNGSSVDGRNLVVNEARPKREGASAGKGGGRSGGRHRG